MTNQEQLKDDSSRERSGSKDKHKSSSRKLIKKKKSSKEQSKSKKKEINRKKSAREIQSFSLFEMVEGQELLDHTGSAMRNSMVDRVVKFDDEPINVVLNVDQTPSQGVDYLDANYELPLKKIKPSPRSLNQAKK